MKRLLIIAFVGLIVSCTNSKEASKKEATTSKANYELVLASEVKWDHLNPKRGDLAPKAGTLWGDRKSNVPTGFLLKPSDGFASPPHIHNISYRGVVIEGALHNDDPNAADMWMPAGSFWTQPKGEVHITCAKGTSSLAYIEIDEGPYLVLPEEEHFDSGERPVNVDETNMVWVNAEDITWIDHKEGVSNENSPKIAFLWGEQQDGSLHGILAKLPARFKGKIISDSEHFRAVVIKGQPMYQTPKDKDVKKLETGSYFGSDGLATHTLSTDVESIIYIRTNGTYEIIN